MATVIDGSAGITTNAGGSVNPSTNVDGINYSCRAWVNFDGTKDTTGATSTSNTNRLIRGSGNVTSVLRNAAGDYTITFTTAMTDANYAATFGYQGDSLIVTGNSRVVQIHTQAAGTCRVQTMAQGTGGALTDFPIVNASIFR